MASTLHRLTLALALALPCAPLLAADNVSKVNGSIEASAGQEYGDLDTVNGSIRIGDGAQVQDASTVNGSITVGANAQVGSLETVNGAIRTGRGIRASGGLETVNGSIFVDHGSVIQGGVETVNGAIGLVGTQVDGNIDTVNGDVTVGVGSHVKGGLTVQRSRGLFNTGSKRKPRIVIGPNAVVEGPLEFQREVRLYVHASARTGKITGAEAVRFDSDTAPQD